MPCDIKRDGNGELLFIACSRGRTRKKCSACSRESTALCDFPVKLSGKVAGTCDRPLCNSCRVRQPGKDVDYCPAHDRFAREQAQQEKKPRRRMLKRGAG